MLAFDRIAEQRILEAIERGDLDRLPGSGRPLELDDDSAVPEEMRMAYRVLRNAGLAPEEVTLRRGIHALEASLRDIDDAARRDVAQRRLALLKTRLEARGGGISAHYDAALLQRLAR